MDSHSATLIEQDTDALVAAVAQLLHREVPELGADPAALAETRASTRAHIDALARSVRTGVPAEPPPEAVAFARANARRGVPLARLLRAYHVAHAFLVDTLALPPELLAASAQQVLAVTQRVAEEYEAERERWAGGAQALRAETIRAILAGEATDVDAASRMLGYELRRHHTGLVLWAGSEETGLLEAAARDVAAALGSARPLVLRAGNQRLWAWVGADRAPVAQQLTALAAQPRDDGVSVAIGAPADGLAGFRRTHRDADDTAAVTMVAQRAPGTVSAYAEHALGALLARDLERARRFVADELGPLARDDATAARLRTTLRVYLDEHAGRLAAARRLGVHENTVAKRVAACRTLLGGDRRLGVELQVALALADALGAAVLADPR